MKFLSVNGAILSDKGIGVAQIEDMFFDWLGANNLSFIGVTDSDFVEDDEDE